MIVIPEGKEPEHMAKSGKKTGGRKTSKRSMLPKRIAGTKVPKALRKSGEQALQWAASPTGREILGGLLVAAATALVRSKKAREAVSEGAKDAVGGAGRMGQAIAGAAAEVVRRTIGPDRESASTDAAPSQRGAAKRGKNRAGAPTFTH
jgi:hypothetical protein